MAIRVATMNPTNNLPLGRKSGHLFRKLTLLFLLTSAYALGLVILYQKRPDFPLLLFSFFADCTVAIAAGFGARLILSKRNWFIRSMAAIIVVTAGQAILGYFSKWEIGLDVPQFLLGYISWMDLIHLSFGAIATLSAVWAWRRSRSIPELNETPAPVSVVPIQPRQPSRSERAGIRFPQTWTLNLGAISRHRIGIHYGNNIRPSVRARSRLVAGPQVKTKSKRTSLQQAHVQLALVEEHRCPYCLEPVLRTDPRGVKECNTCHSLHHADCWAVTGFCQVPHLNS